MFRAQNDRLVIGYLMDTKKFEFQPNLCLWQLFEEGTHQGILANFVTPLIVLSLAIRWAHKLLDLGLIGPCGGCSNRATVKAFWPISSHIFSNPHNFGLIWTFWNFHCSKWLSCHWLSDMHRNILILALFVPGQMFKQGTHKGRFCHLSRPGGLLFVDFTLACCQPNVVFNHKNTH